ncbi:MAG: 2-dehydropantoate 2-reductase [Rubrivivax sp.]
MVQKICVVGLGAVGGMFAAWLGSRSPAGALRLSALARGATLAAVRAHGLLLESGGERIAVPLTVSDDPAALGPQDLVVLAVKGPALAAAAPAVRALCAPHTRVLCAMNGVPWWFFDGLEAGAGRAAGLRLESVDAGGVVRALIAPGRVIGCVVHLSAATPAPGVVRHTGGHALVVGNAVGAPDDSLQAAAALLERAGFDVTRSPRVQRELWFKLWGNMTMNPVSALTGATCDRILDDELVRTFCSAVMREAQALGAAFGIPIAQQPEERHAVTRRLGAIKTSMLQDLEAGRPLELDALLGAVREIGLRLGIATPHVDALFGLARLLGRTRGLYAAGA